jgi:hypothetical protein
MAVEPIFPPVMMASQTYEGTTGTQFEYLAHLENLLRHRYLECPFDPLQIKDLVEKFTVISNDKMVKWEGYLCRGDGYLVRLRFTKTKKRLEVNLAADTDEEVDEALDYIKGLVLQDLDEDSIQMTFWTQAAHGPTQYDRSVQAESWNKLKDNYPSTDLDALMTDFKPGAGGQLILWSGPPGEGKTYALRTFAYQWRDLLKIHYIVDSDKFFGPNSDYLLQVLLEEVEDDENKWRLLVLEDAGELIAMDAKQETGQALSRLLNSCDGLIGQGLKILVLITTNEEVGKLHPAIARPGRCAANIEFKPFSKEQGEAWLKAHGKEQELDGPVTLADLYAQLEGYGKTETKKTMGFS